MKQRDGADLNRVPWHASLLAALRCVRPLVAVFGVISRLVLAVVRKYFGSMRIVAAKMLKTEICFARLRALVWIIRCVYGGSNSSHLHFYTDGMY